ncbi:hypothetical protein AcV5_000885 [Taiwanofungus camphoratus]|nr:hypothetical protein AcV5_000885 [Antrodia cinnamomea]KAI0952396.1 hypothetical protein AcV7_008218 [Antrodia cinnamomea]
MPSQDRARSVSGDIEVSDSSDIGSPHEAGSSSQPGKPGRKKNPNSQAARRDQNRIAQREFRLRKQQRIRDLEASVEILSGGKDEALSHLRSILKDLMHENQVLRDLLRSLSAFIGEGAGGFLSKLGWNMNDFDNFINKSKTDTSWESYQRHKQTENTAGSTASGSGSTAGQKRPSEDDDPLGIRPKRARGLSETNGDGEHGDSFGSSLLMPLNASGSAVGSNGLYPSSSRPAHDAALFNELTRLSSGSPMFIPPSSPPNTSGPYPAPGSSNVGSSYQSSYMSPHTGVTPTPHAPSDEEVDPKKHEAYKLITYHLDNYKRNSQYCLPSSLRPTLVQRTVPHESVIDVILHPELRDRMILLRGMAIAQGMISPVYFLLGRYDLVDCLHDYRDAVTIHGDDVLAHVNWEISETWLRRYKFLVDQATLNTTNRWRRERGEPELMVGDFAPEMAPSMNAPAV